MGGWVGGWVGGAARRRVATSAEIDGLCSFLVFVPVVYADDETSLRGGR